MPYYFQNNYLYHDIECKLIVNGKIIAHGTESEKIQFTFKDRTEKHWKHKCGLIVDDAEGQFINCVFNKFENEFALKVNNSDIFISRCIFSNNKGDAIFLSCSNSIVKENIIENNQKGLSLMTSNLLNIIENNVIKNNDYGLDVRSSRKNSFKIISNEFKLNNKGLQLAGDSNDQTFPRLLGTSNLFFSKYHF